MMLARLSLREFWTGLHGFVHIDLPPPDARNPSVSVFWAKGGFNVLPIGVDEIAGFPIRLPLLSYCFNTSTMLATESGGDEFWDVAPLSEF